MSILKLLGIRKSCVSLSSGTMPVQCGVKKEIGCSAEAGKAPRALWSLFVFLYSTVENYAWFKESVIVLYCLTPEERPKEVFWLHATEYFMFSKMKYCSFSSKVSSRHWLLFQPTSKLPCFPEMLLCTLCFFMKHVVSCALLPFRGWNVTPMAVPQAQCRVKSAQWSPKDLLLQLAAT